ncbi:MAG: tetratricopeptide repeat protein [Bacteroidetes bacterium]|nr:tetratricopeptide repeat protein [Bacteroidota bacterium]
MGLINMTKKNTPIYSIFKYLGLILFLLSNQLISQSNDDKESVFELEKNTTDTLQIVTLTEKCKSIMRTNSYAALQIADTIYQLSNAVGYVSGINNGLFLKTFIYHLLDDNKKAFSEWERLNYYQSKNNVNLASVCKANILGGDIFSEIGNYIRAIECLTKAEKIASEINNDNLKSSVYLSLGGIYHEVLKDFEKATFYYKQALASSFKTNNNVNIAASYNNIGNVLVAQNKVEDAIDYFKKGLALYTKEDTSTIKAALLSNISDADYSFFKNYESSILYAEQALVIYQTLNDKKGIIDSKTRLALCAIAQNEIGKAESYLLEAEQLSNEIDFMKSPELYQAMRKLYETKGDFTNAYKYLSIYTQIKDSLTTLDQIKKIKDIENKALETKSQTEIEILKRESLLNELTKNNAETERNFLLIASFLFLIIAAIVYNMYHLKKISNNALEEKKITIENQKKIVENQKEVIEIAKEKIVDSITYAKTIQQSILPRINYIKTYLPETAIFFQPKDLVSGDFYWFHHEKNISFIAIADCTGHGVPGALMSMIGNSLLNKIIIENKITEPNLILSGMNKNIYEILQQDKGAQQSQDGMDMALCTYNHTTKELNYSGARSNIILVNQKGVNMLKSTTNAVGGLSLRNELEPERNYDKKTIQITEPTLLFMFTDGYADQIGGVEQKKLGITKFKDNVNGTLFLPIEKVVDQLVYNFNSWKSTNTQIDDVLVFCTRLG